MLRSVLLLLGGVFACSISALLIKTAASRADTLSALRLLLAAALLAPLYIRARRRQPAGPWLADFRLAALPALALAAHFLTWSWGARHTPTAQASLIVNLAPIAMPFFLHFLIGERVDRREITGTVLTLAGVLLLTARDAVTAGPAPLGNLVCLGSMLLFTWYLALGRQHRTVPSIWLYIVPVYTVAGLACGVFALLRGHDPALATSREWLLLACLAIGPTIVGHTLLNRAMRTLRGQIVSLANLGQFVFAGVLAFLLFREAPSPVFYVSATLSAAGVAIAVLRPTPLAR
jgi:drug/metabolite transporter (DMT)-like permease